jgi:hypothetical protein
MASSSAKNAIIGRAPIMMSNKSPLAKEEPKDQRKGKKKKRR